MKTLIPILLAALLCGCASVGKNFDSRKIAEIKKGETTEADLVQMFGPPAQRGVNSETGLTLTWIYCEATVKGESFIPFAGAFMGGVNTKNKTLVVVMTGDGKVANYNYSGGGLGTSNMTGSDPEKPAVKPVASPKNL